MNTDTHNEEVVVAIIRAQWARRHAANPVVRRHAKNLIRAHVDWLRKMRGEFPENLSGKAA